MRLETVRVAAVQATPVILDREAKAEKVVRLLGDAAAEGARLAVLPETFVPLYPSNVWGRAAAAFSGRSTTHSSWSGRRGSCTGTAS